MGEPAKFLPFASFIDTAFWSEVNKKKLNEWKLDESCKKVTASIGLGDAIGTECRLSLGHESFDESGQKDDIKGDLIVFNTVEAFKKLNKAEFLKEQGTKIFEAIMTKAWLENPKLLYYFAFTAFADLKKFQYFYWLCNPAVVNYPSDITVTHTPITDPGHLKRISKDRAKNFALIYRGDVPFPLIMLQDCKDSNNVKIVVPDPSPLPEAPGWPVRNFVTAVALLHPNWNSIDIISHRGTSAVIFHFQWNHQPVETPTFTGWEPNAQGKILPRFVDLKNQFDPKRLMEQSVALNLSLIKWRLVPELKLERFEQLKVLILGAGTLGCNLARNLLAYNVKVITFVDNSNVSYSNPVRQSLAKFEDAKEGRGKAETAAVALQEIYPSVDARWFNLTVPMPGHIVAESEEEQLKKTVETLEELVSSHDVIFLALDSREARWLPTVIGSKHSKMVYSVALGFDQFVVIRHGVGKAQMKEETMEEDAPLTKDYLIPSNQLGCYFCCDVTAPGNSTTDRTLDQQCTVSRPGLSPVASGIAVELLASVLQTQDPLSAPAAVGDQDENLSLFGTTPHQVRGYLFRYQQLTPAVRRFESCVACGSKVADAYEKEGWNFVKEVLNSPSYLENVSGVAQIQQSTADLDIEFSDSDSVMSEA